MRFLLIASIYSVFTATAWAVELIVPLPGAGPSVADPGAYIRNIFIFSIGLAGLLAMAEIVFGAVQYTASAGNPSQQGDAKDRILNAIYGLILLVAAFLILYTINPNLVNLGRLDVEQASLPPLPPPTEQEDRPTSAVREFSEARNRAFQALGLPEVQLGRPLPEGIGEVYQGAIDGILTGETEISPENLTLIIDAQERELAWRQTWVRSALERDLRNVRMGDPRGTHDKTMAAVREELDVTVPRLTNNLIQLQQLRSQLQSPPQETPATQGEFLIPDYQF